MNFYGITKGILLEVPHLTDPLNEVLTFLLSQLHGISGFFWTRYKEKSVMDSDKTHPRNEGPKNER